MIRPEHQFYIRPDLRKAASTKAESTTAESVIRPKQLVRIVTQTIKPNDVARGTTKQSPVESGGLILDYM